jgi:hypothetical protein
MQLSVSDALLTLMKNSSELSKSNHEILVKICLICKAIRQKNAQELSVSQNRNDK